MIDVAIQYIKRGFSVIPINPNNKKPFIKWEGYQRNLATETELRGMWHEKPNAMIGIITGELSGICVVDIDKYADDYDESAYSGDREQLSERWRTGDRLMPNRRSEATLRLRTSQKKLPTSMEIVFFS